MAFLTGFDAALWKLERPPEHALASFLAVTPTQSSLLAGKPFDQWLSQQSLERPLIRVLYLRRHVAPHRVKLLLRCWRVQTERRPTRVAEAATWRTSRRAFAPRVCAGPDLPTEG